MWASQHWVHRNSFLVCLAQWLCEHPKHPNILTIPPLNFLITGITFVWSICLHSNMVLAFRIYFPHLYRYLSICYQLSLLISMSSDYMTITVISVHLQKIKKINGTAVSNFNLCPSAFANWNVHYCTSECEEWKTGSQERNIILSNCSLSHSRPSKSAQDLAKQRARLA